MYPCRFMDIGFGNQRNIWRMLEMTGDGIYMNEGYNTELEWKKVEDELYKLCIIMLELLEKLKDGGIITEKEYQDRIRIMTEFVDRYRHGKL
jgi:hypothetical protein